MKEIKDNTDQDVLIYLIGNKFDLEDQREIDRLEGIKCTKEMKFSSH